MNRLLLKEIPHPRYDRDDGLGRSPQLTFLLTVLKLE